MLKRVVTLFMCFLLLVTSVLVVGCSKDEEDAETETESSVVTYAEADKYIVPDVDYDGKDFDVFTWVENGEWVLELTPETPKIDAEVYHHLSTVEQELNLNFVTHKEEGNYGNMGNFATKLSVLSGDDGIDLVCQYSLAAAVGAQQGLYANLLELDYLNWDAPYWSDNLKDTNTINEKMYWCTGDMTASVLKNLYMIVFNYDMASDYQMGDLYGFVTEGKWTLEKLKTLSSTVYSDDNKNSRADVGDTFGFVVGDYVFNDAFQYGCNLPCMFVNNMNELEINPDLYGERGVNVTNKIKELLHNNGNSTYAHTKSNEEWHTCIEDKKAVFSVYTAELVIESLVTTNVNYGILPMPKYDESQDGYYTCLGMPYSMFSVPVIAPDPDVSAAVLESMAHSGYVALSPKVFEALQYRYSKRVEDTEMLTILRDGIIYEPGRIIEQFDIFALVRRTVRDNISITQYYAEGRDNYEEALKQVQFMFS